MNTRILLIEDDPGLVVAVSDLLNAEGYRVEFSLDGAAGFERAGSGPIGGAGGFDCGFRIFQNRVPTARPRA
jgi:CheY-like chemotaxis protein